MKGNKSTDRWPAIFQDAYLLYLCVSYLSPFRAFDFHPVFILLFLPRSHFDENFVLPTIIFHRYFSTAQINEFNTILNFQFLKIVVPNK